MTPSSYEYILPDEPVSVLKPPSGWFNLNLHELWIYRELIYFWTMRDVKSRYKQTVLGVVWAIIQPIMTMIVFTLFFGELANIPSDNIPYPIFSYAALVPWTFFSGSLAKSATSVVVNAKIINQVYFPRLIIPISIVLSGIVDFVLSFAVLLILMPIFGTWPTIAIIWLPYFLLLALMSALGVGMWLSALNVQFRDVRYLVPFITQMWLFITPIAYPSSMIENPWLRIIYSLNPMSGVVEGFRWTLLGTDTLSPELVAVSSVMAVLIMVSGLLIFQKMERSFADVV